MEIELSVSEARLQDQLQDKLDARRNVSGDVVANVRMLMKERGWKRPALRKALESVTLEEWPDHRLRILDQSKPGVRSHISVDELYALCEAFGCSVYELLLPSEDPWTARSRSLTMFGYEATFPIKAWAKKVTDASKQRLWLQFHPDVQGNVLDLQVAAFRTADALRNVEADDSLEYLRAVEADQAAKENLFNAQTSMINNLIAQGVTASQDDVSGWLSSAGNDLRDKMKADGVDGWDS